MKHLCFYILVSGAVFCSNIFAQDVDIIPYLKQIEAGKKIYVEEELPSLISRNPNSPSVMYLQGLLTEDGETALVTFSRILDKYPKSKYADAALFRIFSYYYAGGEYYNANKCLDELKSNYPSSPYIKLAERDIPEDKETSNPEEGKNSNKLTEENVPKYKYTIQAGAFTKQTNASSLKNTFEDNGFYSEIKEKIVAGTTFRVVYVGRFEKKDEAENFLHVINSEFKLEGRIVEIP